MTKYIQLRITDEDKENLKKLSKNMGVPLATYCRIVLKDEIKKHLFED